MSKLMLINVTHAEESRVGIVTNGVLTAFEIESFSREHLKGNIYRGVIHRIHPALEAAFVDIGGERDAFLPLDEICYRNLPNPPERTNGGEGRKPVRIQEILKPGDELLVQIVKEEFGNKPPTLSTFHSLPGRYLVLLPGSDDSGISRRIEGDERQRIRELIGELQAPEGFGIIVRTVAGFDQGARELQRDLSYLLRLWESIQHTADQRRAPALVYREHDLVLRNIRDYFTSDVDEIWVDNDEVFERARDFLREVMPEKQDVIRLYEGDKPLFSQFDVEAQIESIYKRRVTLRSGGSIVIDGTEALTAIDVNSGRSTRGTNQEETAHRTNCEAALEIARQLRLRDVGGLIVIDFIDMRNPQHISEVERILRQAMHEDKARHEVGRISQFGLLEVSRQRLRPAAAATSYLSCPMCEGYGLVRTTESAALVGLRKIHNRIAKGDVAGLRAVFPADVGLYLLNQKRDDLAQLERRYATKIQVAFDDRLMPHQFESEVRLRSEGEQLEQKPLRLGGIAAADPRGAGRRSGRGPNTRGEAKDSGRPAQNGSGGSEPARPAPPAAESGQTVTAQTEPAAKSESRQSESRQPGRREDRRNNRRPQPEAGAEATAAVASGSPSNPQPADDGEATAGASATRVERAGKRSRRRRGRRRGRGTGVQAAFALADWLRGVASASPALAEMIAAAAEEAAAATAAAALAGDESFDDQEDDGDVSETPRPGAEYDSGIDADEGAAEEAPAAALEDAAQGGDGVTAPAAAAAAQEPAAPEIAAATAVEIEVETVPGARRKRASAKRAPAKKTAPAKKAAKKAATSAPKKRTSKKKASSRRSTKDSGAGATPADDGSDAS